MIEIETFKCPMLDEENKVGSMMIIRGVFPKDANKDGTKSLFMRIVRDIAHKDQIISTIFIPDNDPNYCMAVVIDDLPELSFKHYACEEIIRKYIQ